MTPEKNSIGDPFIELQSVDSTNNYAMRQAHAGVAQHGAAVFAHAQSAGKGQRQKQWLAQPGANVLLSVILTPPLRFQRPSFLFSMAMAVAVHGLLKKLVGDSVKIKWPNDLYIGDRKAGGILIENIVGSRWKFAVVGIGLNCNQTEFGDLHNKAVSLKQITGKEYDTIALAKDLCRAIDGVLKKLETDGDAIIHEYLNQLYKKEEWIKLKQGTRVFETQVKGVNAAGQLVTQNAVEEVFDVGGVEWVMA